MIFHYFVHDFSRQCQVSATPVAPAACAAPAAPAASAAPADPAVLAAHGAKHSPPGSGDGRPFGVNQGGSPAKLTKSRFFQFLKRQNIRI